MSFPLLKILQWHTTRSSILLCGLVSVVIGVSLIFSLAGISAAEQPLPPQVIILNSYHQGFSWSDKEVAGVFQELRRVYPKIDPAIEYLDTKRFPSDEHLIRVKDFLASKYQGHKFDLVIALDNPSLKLALDYRKQLFPKTPIVFAGINDFTPAMLAGQQNVTGVAEIQNIEGTLNTALALHPETTEIFIITDYTMTGKAAKQEIEAVLPRLPAGVQVNFAPPATMGELVEKIKGLPATAIILISGFTTDKAGQAFSTAEEARILTQKAKVPTYIVHEPRLGHGPVGGMLLNGMEEGRRAGEIALRVLAGEDPSHIPIDTKSSAQPMFDYHQLERFKIPLKSLPASSIIINRPSTFYEVNKALVWGASGVVIALGVVILVLGVNISRRRRAEMDLQHHVKFLQNLVDTIPNPVFFKDKKGIYLGCNKALEEFLKLPKKSIVGKSVFDIYPKDLAEKYFAMDQELFHQPGIQIYEFEMEKPGGARREFIFNKATFLGPEAGVGGLIGVMTDITERKQAEKALQQSEEKFRLAMEATQDGVWDWDVSTGEVYYSPGWSKILGFQPQEVSTEFEFWSTRIHPDDITHTLQILEDHFAGKLPSFICEHRLLTKEGEYKWVLGRGRVVKRSSEGKPLRVIGIMTDITERKQAEKALRESEEKFRLVFQKAPAGIMHYDQTSTITDCNEKFAEIIGAPKEKFIGFNMMRQLQDEQMRKAVADSLHGKVGYYEGNYLSVTAGKLTPVRAIYQPTFSLEGSISGGITIFEDITERKQAEEELLKSEATLKTILRASPTAIGLVKNRVIQWVNETMVQISGFSYEELLGQSARILYPSEEEYNRVGQVKYDQIQNRGWGEIDTRWQTKDGRLKEINLSSVALDPANLSAGVVFTAMDITERKRAEEELRLKEKLLDSASDSIFLHDLEGQFLYVNEAAYITRLYNKAELLDGKVSMLTTPEAATNRESILKELLAKGELIFESEHLRKDGSVMPVEIYARVLEVGGRELILSVTRDITERKRAEEELRNAAHKWRTTFDAITDGVCLLDPDGRILQFNLGLANLINKPFADILGQPCYKIIHGASQYIPECPLVRMRESRQHEEALLAIGNSRYKVGVDPIFDEAGNLVGAVHIMSDVTQLTEAEKSLYRRSQELMVLNTIGSVISRSLNLNDILEDSLWMIQNNIFEGHSRIIVFLMDEATGQLKAISHRGVSGDHPCLGNPVNLGECLCGRAVLTREIIFTQEGCKDQKHNSFSPDFDPHQDICLPLKVGDRVLGVMHMSVNPDQEVDERHLKLLEAIADQISMAMEKARLFEQVKLQRAQLRTLAIRLAEIEEAERKVLARELHDQVGQSLTTLSLYLTMLQEQMPRKMPEKIMTRLSEATALVEDTADSVREIMAELRPPVLDDFGLLAAARWYGKQFSKSTGINLQASGEDPTPRLDRKVEVGLFRIIQEALTNVAKHSKASRVKLTEEVLDNMIRLTIADNGIGFDPAQVGQPEGRHRWGLMNMSERALAAGGTCRIDSRPGGGTRVIVEINREVLSLED